MPVATVQQVAQMLAEGLERLQAQATPEQVEDLATTIHRIMSVEARQYHSLEHVSLLWDMPRPTQSLAAPFHDLVHYQVDQGIPPDVLNAISSYIREEQGQVYLEDNLDLADRPLMLTLEIFGFRSGQELLPAAGLNEFLSALFMSVALQDIVSEPDLVRMIACIEATIPFRGEHECRGDCSERLESRLHDLKEHAGLAMTTAEIQETVRAAIDFGNRDVIEFAKEDVAHFLDNTWKLLPETNASLRAGRIYSIRQFRLALWKMERFMDSLHPEAVFHRSHGTPPEEEYRDLVERARKNIEVAREYLRIKLLALAILESLAELSGGDAPVTLFMGPAEGPAQKERRLEDFLPAIEAPYPPDISPTIVRLLESGRASESSFDIRESPLSLFLYHRLGGATIEQVQDHVQALFAGELNPHEFLKRLDRGIVAAVAHASAAMVPTRREALLQYDRLS